MERQKKTFKKELLDVLKRYSLIVIGAVVYSFGYVAFVQKAGITNGGITGLLGVVNILYTIPIGLVYFCINIPLLITAFIKCGWRFSVATLIGTGLESLFLSIFQFFLKNTVITENIIISAVFGGAMLGIGLGLIMRNGSSTGGTDIVLKLLHRRFPHLKAGLIALIIDALILVFYLCVVRDFDMCVFALLTVVVENILYDLVLYGTMGSKTVYIITSKPDEIVRNMLEEMEIGATLLSGQGAYTQENRQIILCVVKNNQFPELKNLVRDNDDRAFMIVGKSAEIYGEGYQDYHKDVL